MAGRMYRRDSFASGTYVDEKLHAYVGWTCHHGSYADCLPIKSASGDLALFFAGEHYAPEGDEEERVAKGARCSPHKAEVLRPLYREKGEAFFPYLNGFFHGLIIDSRSDQVILFNDRFGMQRLYYHEEPDAFYFASEAKSILAVRPELRAFDLKGLGEWMSCGAVLENRSLFRGIDVLPAAARWTWRLDGALEKRTYFAPESWEGQPQLGPEEFYQKLRATFLKRLPTYLVSEGPVGLSTTGGLDTRMILANLGAGKSRIHCYSFNGPYRENLDVSIGRRVARAAGIAPYDDRHHEHFFRGFGQIAEDVILCTDGNLELSGAPNIYVNRIGREISPDSIDRQLWQRGPETAPRLLPFELDPPGAAAGVGRVRGQHNRLLEGHPASPSLELRGLPASPLVQLQPAAGGTIRPGHEGSVHGQRPIGGRLSGPGRVHALQ